MRVWLLVEHEIIQEQTWKPGTGGCRLKSIYSNGTRRPRTIRPVDCQDGSGFEFHGTLANSAQQRGTPYLRDQWLTARRMTLGFEFDVREDPCEIQIVVTSANPCSLAYSHMLKSVAPAGPADDQ